MAIKISILVLIFFSTVTHSHGTDTVAPYFNLSELQEKGSKYINKKFAIKGYLVQENKFVVFPTISSIDTFDHKLALVIKDDRKKIRERLLEHKGCNVIVSGTLIKTPNDTFQLTNIETIMKSGYIYISSKENSKKEPKCILNALADLMSQ